MCWFPPSPGQPMPSKEYFMYSCPGSNLKSASPAVLCVFEINANAALAQFLNVILTWSLSDAGGPSWAEHGAAPPAEWFRCCSAAGTSFSNYKFIKSESHQQSLELLFQKYIWLISFSPFLICSMPNIFFFFFIPYPHSPCFSLCLAKKTPTKP